MIQACRLFPGPAFREAEVAHAERRTLGRISEASGKDFPYGKRAGIPLSGDWRGTLCGPQVKVDYAGDGGESMG